ncbi:MAG: WD40/YVTN/BNR-like repeat-containing protein [Acidobacteriaceae bacterium]
MYRAVFRTIVALALSCCLASAASRPGGFRVIGPGGGGAMFNPTISPHDPNTVLVSCDMTGSYITHDGGRSWRMFNLRGVTRFFVFDPLAPHTMYAETIGLWRSTDDGVSWKLIYPKPSAVQGIEMSSDHAEGKILAQPNPLGTIVALAIDPADSRTLYAAAGEKDAPALFVSHNYGESWQKEVALPEVPRHLWVDPYSLHKSRTLIIVGAHFVVTKSITGMSKSELPSSASITDSTVGFAAPGRSVLYVTSKRGGFVSRDGGTSWHAITLPGTGASVRAVATSLHHPETAYISYSHLNLNGSIWHGVAKTVDAGRTWKLVWKESVAAAPNVHDAWITETFGTDWGENPLMLGVADQDPNLCYGTDFGRTLATTDGGENWSAKYSRRVLSAGWTTTGLNVTTDYGIHFDPFDMKRQFITYTDIGLFRSEDAGKSWTSSIHGVPAEWSNTTYWVVFDPKVRGRMWSVNSGAHDLPRPKMWRHTSVETFKGGVCRSDDGGRTWKKSNAGMKETAATDILLDPKSPPDARVLYVTGFGRGVYKSSDSGATWSLKNTGITQHDPLAWRLARASNGVLYVVLARRSEDGSIGNDGDGALYESKDGAETWTRVTLPHGVNGPNGLAIDPQNPKRLYLAAWARAVGTHGRGGGIYISNDGGKIWRQVFSRDQHVYDVTIDPRNPDVLYAAGFESSAWKSSDRGEHWRRIAGPNFKWMHRVIPDPTAPGKIYITTFGGGVWHGDANAKPGPQDIATPKLQPGR